ncbi:MAG: co-chaperone YbbN [Proteobacteria bacterium]|nr:co-chaperone YbbN [Pseudomonadota bacterium]
MQETAQAGLAPAALGGNSALIKDGTDASFEADVLAASREVPVIIDLWAPWCGPCRTLGPTLEKTVTAANGAVRLVKINVDENPVIASQLRVQSIPAVYAFKDGQPVDGFLGAVPESQVQQFVQRLAAASGPTKLDMLLDEAEAAREDGDAAAADALFGQALKSDSGNARAPAGLAQCYLDGGDLVRARETLDLVPPAKAGEAPVRSARAALELKEIAAAPVAGGSAELEAKVAANANDHQARFDLSMQYANAGRRMDAVDQLLEIVSRDRAWNDEAARKQLVNLFEVFGPKDEATTDGRRRLSSILFA